MKNLTRIVSVCLFACFTSSLSAFDLIDRPVIQENLTYKRHSFPKHVTMSRFVKNSDQVVYSLMNMQLPKTWWSRTYEYAWAANFLGPNLVVLDAACGIAHPFKWVMTKTCQETWACDFDKRITDKYQIMEDTFRDFGQRGVNELMENSEFINKAHLVECSICDLPDSFPLFDRIFCISTLEHMTKEDRQKALNEFAKKLKQDGLIILTMDYPVVTPEELIQDALECGLVPLSDVDYELPHNALTFEPDNYTSSIRLNIFRCVLKHKE